MLSFSTDDLRPQDRFDHWCEVRGKSLFGVTIELPAGRRNDFAGRFAAKNIGGAIVSDMRASSYVVSRTPGDIARLSGDSLCIGLQIRGPGWIDTGRSRIHEVSEGDLIVSHSDQPFQATPIRSDGFDYRTIKIPLGGDVLLGAVADDLSGAPVVAGTPHARALAAMLNALASRPHAPAGASIDVTHLARLALVTRDRLKAGMPEIRAALRAGLLYQAMEMLRLNLHRPDLSPAWFARSLGISLRQVHVLFEPTGRTFAETLSAMRIERVCVQLQQNPARGVADIAYSCGFDSMATFYRLFRRAQGMTPGDLREQSPAPVRSRAMP